MLDLLNQSKELWSGTKILDLDSTKQSSFSYILHQSNKLTQQCQLNMNLQWYIQDMLHTRQQYLQRAQPKGKDLQISFSSRKLGLRTYASRQNKWAKMSLVRNNKEDPGQFHG